MGADFSSPGQRKQPSRDQANQLPMRQNDGAVQWSRTYPDLRQDLAAVYMEGGGPPPNEDSPGCCICFSSSSMLELAAAERLVVKYDSVEAFPLRVLTKDEGDMAVESARCGMLDLGLRTNEVVALFADGTSEMPLALQAAFYAELRLGFIPVNSDELAIKRLLQNRDFSCQMVVVSDYLLGRLIKVVQSGVRNLEGAKRMVVVVVVRLTDAERKALMAAKCTALTWARLLERGRAAPRPASTRTDKLSFVIPHLTTRESVAVVMEPATPLEQFEAVLSGELEGKLPRAVTIENHMVYFVSNAWLDVKERLQWASAACALTGTVLGASILYWPASKDIGDKVRYWLIAFFMFIAVLFLAYTAHKDKVLEKRTKRLRLMGDGKDLSRSDVASMAAGVAAPQAAEMIPD